MQMAECVIKVLPIVIILIFSSVVSSTSSEIPKENTEVEAIPPPPAQTPDLGYFALIGSRVIRNGSSYRCSVTNFNYPGALLLKISLNGVQIDGVVQNLTKKISLNESTTELVEFFDAGDFLAGNYSIIVKSLDPKLKFQREKKLYYNDKSFSIFIQFSQPIYRPGDVLKFRLFGVNLVMGSFSPNDTSIDIYDSKNFLIKSFRNATLVNGTYSNSLQLASELNMGLWKVDVNTQNQTFSKSFNVQKHEIENFKVKVDVPPHIYFDNGTIPVTIKATYVFGKPFQGMAILKCKEDNLTLLKKTFKIFGELTKEIDLKRDLGYTQLAVDQNLQLEVTVFDTVTEKSASATAITTVHNKFYYITMEGADLKALVYSYVITIRRFDEVPAASQSLIKVNTQFHNDSMEIERFEQEFVLNAKGQAKINILSIPVGVNHITIEVQFNEVVERFTRSRVSSASAWISVTPLSKPNLHTEYMVAVETSEDITGVTFCVFARGVLVQTKMIRVLAQSAAFILPIRYIYIPEFQIIVYYIRKDGEMVSEFVTVPASAFSNFIEIKSSKTGQYSPGENASFTVHSTRYSNVNFLAVDQRALVYGNDHDITRDTFANYLHSLSRINQEYDDYFDKDTEWYYIPDNYEKRFQESGKLVISNAQNTYKLRTSKTKASVDLDTSGNIENDLQVTESETPSIVPSYFAESFLWESVVTSEKDGRRPRGKATLNFTVPDTLTSWVLSAVTHNRNYGIAIFNNNVNIDVFKQFFLQTSLPFSVKMAEILLLEIYLHSYLNEDQTATIQLEVNDDFDSIGHERFGWQKQAGSFVIEVMVASEGVTSVQIPVIPKIVGIVTIKIIAMCNVAGDTLVQKLKVVSEGQLTTSSSVHILQKTQTTTKSRFSLECSIPDDALLDSIEVELEVSGNLLGNTLGNLGDLNQMTHGSGELNLVHLIPNILLLTYLQNTRQMTDEMFDRLTVTAVLAYQKQLGYRESDGSFSIYPNAQHNGSLTLTATTAKAIYWAKSFIDVDLNVVRDAVSYLTSHQVFDGSFIELDLAFDDSTLSTTAYIAITLIELLADFPDISESLDRALDYVYTNANFTDPNSLSIVTYALCLADHPDCKNFLGTLNQLAIESTKFLYWESTDHQVSEIPNTKNIEISSYALLAYIVSESFTEKAPKIVKFLISQRNSVGGFWTSQATLVALEALVSFDALMKKSVQNLELEILTDANEQFSTTIGDGDTFMLQGFELDQATRSLNVTATGIGFGVISLKCNYFTLNSDSSSSFNISVSFVDSCDRLVNLQVCLAFAGDEDGSSSNLVLITVDLPSGFVYNNKPILGGNIEKVESESGGQTVILHVSRLTQSNFCFVLSAEQQFSIRNRKLSTIFVKDFYDTRRTSLYTFSLPKLERCK